MISYRVMRVDEFDDSVFYRIACACGSKDHEFELWLEYEKIYKRLFAGLKLIFGGYLEMQADVLFMDKEHIEGFIEALQEGIIKIEHGSPKWPEGPERVDEGCVH